MHPRRGRAAEQIFQDAKSRIAATIRHAAARRNRIIPTRMNRTDLLAHYSSFDFVLAAPAENIHKRDAGSSPGGCTNVDNLFLSPPARLSSLSTVRAFDPNCLMNSESQTKLLPVRPKGFTLFVPRILTPFLITRALGPAAGGRKGRSENRLGEQFAAAEPGEFPRCRLAIRAKAFLARGGDLRGRKFFELPAVGRDSVCAQSFPLRRNPNALT